MKHLPLLLSIAALATLAAPAHAQFITWSEPFSITGDSDIQTTGTYIDAFKTASVPAGTPDYTTANGVTFHANAGTYSDGIITLSGTDPGTNSGIGSASTPDSVYNAILTGIAYFYGGSGPGSGMVTLSGLTQGDSYRVEIWNTGGLSGYPDTSYVGATPTDSVSFADNYAFGTFIATGSTASFAVLDGGGFPMVNAVALYSVPEPSTYAMIVIGLGLLALVAVGRFRKLST
jgi:hypothetical protein